ncbi:protein kinase domain-containing protein [Nannocystaceae bacterium ST9]
MVSRSTPERAQTGASSWAAQHMDTADEAAPVSDPALEPTQIEPRLAVALAAGLRARASERHELVGARIGRFAVLRELGRGGMGVVYLCYDEQLDRKVAVKLLGQRTPSERAKQRLEREAQALARLSHPNVVQIYERGDHHGSTFVAMEYVVGRTLRAWMRERDHALRERVRVLRECGAGLAAAHAQELVHRDFKPDNVLVGSDGRARVLDFGVARRVDQSELETTSESNVGDDSSESLTQTGARVGTPAYMSPEQLAARPCDARSDQFSFCVVGFELLFGTRPFVADDLEGLAWAIGSGTTVAIPSDAALPKSLRAAILRGLSPHPEQRWPDMQPLLAELDRVLDSRRPRRLAWALAGAGVVALALPFVRSDAEPTALCELDERALQDAWDADDRAALQGRLEPSVAAQAELRLDTWRTNWLAASRRVCEATHVAGTQSSALLDLRSSCLELERLELAQLVDLLADASSPSDARALALLDALPDPARCEDPRLASTMHPLPEDPALREPIEQALAELARVRALASVRRLDEADAALAAVEQRVAAIDYAPLRIELDGLTGQRLAWRRRITEALPHLRKAIGAAEREHLDELAAELRVDLAAAVAGRWGSPDMQALLLDEAELALARLGRDDPRWSLRLALARARRAAAMGDHGQAEPSLRACIEAAEAAGLAELARSARRELGHLLVELGRFDAAEQAYAAAYALPEAGVALAAEHRLMLGLLHMRREQLELAAADFDAVERELARLVVPDIELLALLALGRAKLSLMQGELDVADHALVRVIELANDDLRVSEAIEARGVIAFYRGEYSMSLEHYRSALALRLATLGEGPSVGMLYSNIGESQAALGDHAAALDAYADALALLGRVLPPDHLDLAFPYKGRGKSRLARGDHAGAILDLEQALRLHEANPGEPLERADVEDALARARMAQTHDDRE